MDMLARLYALPAKPPGPDGYSIRRVLPSERHSVRAWIAEHFAEGWADEFEVASASMPPSVFVAMDPDGGVAGFACYDAAFRGFFGPVGVAEPHRGSGLGKALTLATLHAMREAGYAYAVIGWVSDEAFYRDLVGAETIPDSEPGAYAGKLS